jgi:tRNA threonylcarbamoyladenosine biosynthesis protein TsaB
MEGIYLGITTTEKETGIAFVQEDKILHELIMQTEAQHNETLFTYLDDSFKTLNLTSRQLSGIGVVIGTGMFTSIRVGIACAKGLAIVDNIPIKGFKTLDALVFSLPDSIMSQNSTIIPVIDIRHNEVYYRIYQGQKPLSDAQIVKSEQFAEKIIENAMVFGSGMNRYLDMVKNLAKVNFTTYDIVIPNPSRVAFHAAQCIKNNDYADIETLVPFYIR